MNITLTGLLILIVIAGVCGAIGRAIVGDSTRGGLLISIVLGFVGAIIGPFVANALELPEPLLVNVEGRPFPILWSILGAALFVALVYLVRRGAPGGWRAR